MKKLKIYNFTLEYSSMLQNTDCYGTGFIFEDLIINLDPPKSESIGRTIITPYNRKYNLEILNNIASCHVIQGTVSLEDIESVKRYLSLTINRSPESSRLISEFGYKLFVYIPTDIDASKEFQKSLSCTYTTIFGREINSSCEWYTKFTSTLQTDQKRDGQTVDDDSDNTKKYVFNFNMN